MKFLFLYLILLILFSILPLTIFILLKTWLSSGTTCSLKVWMLHSRPLTVWKRILPQNIQLYIFLHPVPSWIILFHTRLSNFLEKYDDYNPLALRVCIFSLTMFSKLYWILRQQIPDQSSFAISVTYKKITPEGVQFLRLYLCCLGNLPICWTASSFLNWTLKP